MLIIIQIIIIIALILWYKYQPFKLNNRIFFAILLLVLCIVLFRFGQVILSAIIALSPILIRVAQLIFRNLGILNIFKYFSALKGQRNQSRRNKISKSQAYEILGLDKTASEKEIKAKYRKLIKNNHPDSGGSKYLSSLINNAKDKLLGK